MNTVLIFLALPFHTSAQRRVPISQPLYAHCANFVRVSDYIVYDSLLSVRAQGGTAENTPRYRDSVRVVPSGGPFMLVVEYLLGGHTHYDTLWFSNTQYHALCHRTLLSDACNDSQPILILNDTIDCRKLRLRCTLQRNPEFAAYCPLDSLVLFPGIGVFLLSDSAETTHFTSQFAPQDVAVEWRNVSDSSGWQYLKVPHFHLSNFTPGQDIDLVLDFTAPEYACVHRVVICVDSPVRRNFRGVWNGLYASLHPDIWVVNFRQ